MGVTDKMWEAITTVIKMNDKVERMAGTIRDQQTKIENLTGRVIRLETALEIALAAQGVKLAPPLVPVSSRSLQADISQIASEAAP